MPADEHFNSPDQPGPPAMEDHEPNDMPAARGMMVVIGAMLVLGLLVASVLYYAG